MIPALVLRKQIRRKGMAMVRPPQINVANSVLIKCKPYAVPANGIVEFNQRQSKRLKVQAGTEAFIWLDLGEQQQGLTSRGIVRGVTSDGALLVAVGKEPARRALTIAALRTLPRSDTSTVLGKLAAKVYWHSHDKVAEISADVAEFLRGHFASDVSSEELLVAQLNALERDIAIKQTDRQTFILARLGQGEFRRDVLAKWGGQCAVTSCGVLEALRAGHIKPWSACTNQERLDPDNGLPLLAHLDALFDVGLISFDSSGKMLLSAKLGVSDLAHFPAGRMLRLKLTARQMAFLEYHRTIVFRP